MYTSKAKIDQHVNLILGKLRDEEERKNRGFQIAKLYYQSKEYETAKKYLHMFLSVKEGYAPAHKLMGQLLEHSSKPEDLKRAILSYKRAYELDKDQRDLVLKICSMYSRLDVSADTASAAHYWVELAKSYYPNDQIIFTLEEKLIGHALNVSNSSRSGAATEDLEDLLCSNVAYRPGDVSLRLKLLKLLETKGKLDVAWEYIVDVWKSAPYQESLEWCNYTSQLLRKIVSQTADEAQWCMYILLCYRAARQVMKCRPENQVPDMIKRLDSSLFGSLVQTGSVLEYVREEVAHQMWLLCAFLLLKRKSDSSAISALLLASFSYRAPSANPVRHAEDRKSGTATSHNGAIINQICAELSSLSAYRLTQAGYMVLDRASTETSSWMRRLSQQYFSQEGKNKLYSLLFGDLDGSLTSHWLNSGTFEGIEPCFPERTELMLCTKAAQSLRPSSLHDTVWLAMRMATSSSNETVVNNMFDLCPSLQLGPARLDQSEPESMSQLDLLTFLLLTMRSTSLRLDENHVSVSDLLPSDLTAQLCSDEQQRWWAAVYDMFDMEHTSSSRNPASPSSFGRQRQLICRGLETVRLCSAHGLDASMLAHVARSLNAKLESVKEAQGKVSRDARILGVWIQRYYSEVVRILSAMSRNQGYPVSREKLFVSYEPELRQEAVGLLLAEARLWLALHDLEDGKSTKALTELESLPQPLASYKAAEVYLKEAEDILSLEEEGDQSESTVQKEALLFKSRDCLHITLDRLRSDRNNPLNSAVSVALDRVEALLEPHSAGNNVSRDSFLSTAESPSKLYSNGGTAASTPAPSQRLGLANTLRSLTGSDLAPTPIRVRPSPERLDAQMRTLANGQETLRRALSDERDKNNELNRELVESRRELMDTNKKLLDANKELVERFSAMHLDMTLAVAELKRSQVQLQAELVELRSQSRTAPSQSYTEVQLLQQQLAAMTTLVASLSTNMSATNMSGYVSGSYGTPTRATPTQYPVNPAEFLQLGTYPHMMPPQPGGKRLTAQESQAAAAVAAEHGYFGDYVVDDGTDEYYGEGYDFDEDPSYGSAVGRAEGIGTISYHPKGAATTSKPMPGPGFFSQPKSQQKPTEPKPAEPDIPPNVVIGKDRSANSCMQTAAIPAGPLVVNVPKSSNTMPSNSDLFSMNLSSAVPKAPILQGGKVTSPLKPIIPGGKDVLSPAKSDGGYQEDESHDPHYDPVIELPPEIEIVTGEEDETVMFEHRAKLFRMVDKEWKERGLGPIKILQRRDTPSKCRILMRRDQIHKICANHTIHQAMSLSPMGDKGLAWIWKAKDYSEPTPTDETFAVRFKEADIADQFKKAFDKARDLALSQESPTKPAPPASKNPAVTAASPVTEKPRNASPSKAASFGSAGVSTAAVTSLTLQSHVSTPNTERTAPLHDGSNTSARPPAGSSALRQAASNIPTSGFTPSHLNSTTGLPGFNPAVTQTADANKLPSAAVKPLATSTATALPTTPILLAKITSASTTTTTATQSTVTTSNVFGTLSAATVSSTVGTASSTFTAGNIFGSKPPMFTSPATASPCSDNSLLRQLLTSETKSSPEKAASTGSGGFSVTGTQKVVPPPADTAVVSKPTPFSGFSFTPAASVASSGFKFGATQSSKSGGFNFTPPSSQSGSNTSLNSSISGSIVAGSGFGFSIKPADLKPSNSAPQLSLKVVELEQPESPEHSPTKGADTFFEPDVDFKPVISLPELQEVKTGEEDLTPLLVQRCKLFRFADGEWKEKGIGDIKILKYKEKTGFRMLMRREQVLKLCVNHAIDKNMKLHPHQSSDLYWNWIANDFSDGELKQENFLVKFKTPELAASFKRVCDDCIKQLTEQKETSSSEAAVPRAVPKSLADQFKPKEGEWKCQTCYVVNKAASLLCSCCQTLNPANPADKECASHSKQVVPPTKSGAPPPTVVGSLAPSKNTLTDLFKPKEGEWTCCGCYAKNTANTAVCLCCQTHNPATTKASSTKPDVQTTKTNTQISTAPAMPSFGFTFGSSAAPSVVAPAFSFPATITFGSALPALGVAQTAGSSTQSSTGESTPSKNVPGSPGAYENEDGEDDHIHFEPVIALPDLVEVKTGEEDEDVLFCHRAKLYRFKNEEWKERGLGDLKLLRHQRTGKVRLLLRREKIHKLACNHYVTANMELKPMANADGKAWVWFAIDFAESERCEEQFAVRFKTAEVASQFKDCFDNAKQGKGTSSKEPSHEQNSESSRIENPTQEQKAGTYPAVPSQTAASTPSTTVQQIQIQPSSMPSFQPPASTGTTALPAAGSLFGSLFGGKQTAATLNPVFGAAATPSAVFSAAAKPTSVFDIQQKTDPVSVFGAAATASAVFSATSVLNNQQKIDPVSVFGARAVFGSATATRPVFGGESAIGSVFGSQPISMGSVFSGQVPATVSVFGGQASGAGSVFGGQASGAGSVFGSQKNAALVDAVFGGGPHSTCGDDDIVFLKETKPSKENIELAAKYLLPAGFYQYTRRKPCTGCIGCEQNEDNILEHLFYGKPYTKLFLDKPTTVNTKSRSQTEAPGGFAAYASSGGDFASLSAVASGNDAFQKKSDFKWNGAGTTLFQVAPKANTSAQEEDASGAVGGADEAEAYEPEVQFKPVLEKLPDLIEIKTGEEDEEKVFSQRAKLFRMDAGQWKERGVGELKLLKHVEKGTVRVLLRREQVHKLVCNHHIRSDMKLLPMATSEQAWCWFAKDFSENEPKDEQFCVKFKNVELALEFKLKFDECRDYVSQARAGKPDVQMKNVEAVQPAQKLDVSRSIETLRPSQVDQGAACGDNAVGPVISSAGAEEDDDGSEDEEIAVLFEKKATLFQKQGTSWVKLGLRTVQVVEEQMDVIGGIAVYLLEAIGDDEEDMVGRFLIFSESNPPAVDMKQKTCSWEGYDFLEEHPRRMAVQAQFSSALSCEEFQKHFLEGIKYAKEMKLTEMETLQASMATNPRELDFSKKS